MCSHGVSEALKLRLHGPCRNIHSATNLTERNILAITKWYHESPHFKYKYSSGWGSWEKGSCRKQWMAFCEQLCQARPEFTDQWLYTPNVEPQRQLISQKPVAG